MQQITKMILYTDFCLPKDQLLYYNKCRIKPEKADKEGLDKKPSQNANDMYNFMNAISTNLTNGQLQLL